MVRPFLVSCVGFVGGPFSVMPGTGKSEGVVVPDGNRVVDPLGEHAVGVFREREARVIFLGQRVNHVRRTIAGVFKRVKVRDVVVAVLGVVLDGEHGARLSGRGLFS